MTEANTISLAAARDMALQHLAGNEAARAERWVEFNIDSDEELAMAMDVLRGFIYSHENAMSRWMQVGQCDCPLCVRARTLLGGGR